MTIVGVRNVNFNTPVNLPSPGRRGTNYIHDEGWCEMNFNTAERILTVRCLTEGKEWVRWVMAEQIQCLEPREHEPILAGPRQRR